jgi:hypothetical protein
MLDFEQRIAEWRQTLAATLDDRAEVIEELESHLREEIQRLVEAGHPPERVFETALSRLGNPQALAEEFAKVPPPRGTSWLPARLAVFALIAFYGLIGFLMVKVLDGGMSPLLAGHVCALTSGYVATLFVGLLAICYLAARPFTVINSAQGRSLTRTAWGFTLAALTLTALGMVLGGVWAQEHRGRFWSWDPREIAAVLILGWNAAMLFVFRRHAGNVLAGMLLGIVGNVVVILGWLGAGMVAAGLQAHPYGHLNYALLLAIVSSQLAFLCLGLAPAGCLQRRRFSRET